MIVNKAKIHNIQLLLLMHPVSLPIDTYNDSFDQYSEDQKSNPQNTIQFVIKCDIQIKQASKNSEGCKELF